ncbi:ribosome maturation factor RimM [Oscillatoria sp. FACHB-1406]|uniref:ribosome maturation factor RimM n=1 Tax=Oscillatoria sp. FACHB-1406 TaxID=2692846 RepID=UPI00168334F5|nr:ribosome maturation factor RimM [Oscillatoria sp. FACHB-1406]MBD2579288.1 ribosome maturation factor RimM [Oscillatoria sp. FACHB-1406]
MNEQIARDPIDTDEWLEIGKIVSPQGLQGELRVYPTSDFPDRFEKPGKRWLQAPNSSTLQETELLRGRYIPGKNLYVVQLAGVDNRDRAEALRNCKLFVVASDRPQLEEDEYHIRDLIGLNVIDQTTGNSIGEIISILVAGNDLLEVKLHSTLSGESEPLPTETKPKKKGSSPKPETVLIPFVKKIVPVVDLEARRVEIVPPEGLLQLNRASKS